MALLLDGAAAGQRPLTPEVGRLSAIAADPAASLADRLEAFEDIISLDVGDTNLTRARNLEREHDLRQVFLKYEGDNPTGTQKDRIAYAQAHDALRRGYDTVVAATCGNYGVAVASACALAGLRCEVYIPAAYHTERAGEMERLGAHVNYLEGTYEEVVEASGEIARAHRWYDSNPGGSNTPLQLAAYAQIAFEIYDQLRDAPRYLAAPVSNGTLLAGVHRGFVTLYKRGKTSRIPHFIAGSSSRKNPIVTSFLKGHDHIQDLDPASIRETRTNEPLINWHSFDGAEALHALRSTAGHAAHCSDAAMKRMSSYLKKQDGLSVLPASTAGLLALLQLHEKQPLGGDRYVVLVTARG